MHRASYLVVVLGVLFLLVGCPSGDDDSALSDDDDIQDDDSGDDDSADQQQLVDWAYHTIDAWFETAGGVDGGPAVVRVIATFYSEQDVRICEKETTLQGEFTFGTEQGDELFSFTDELIVPTTAVETAGDCHEDFDATAEKLMDLWEWSVFPLAFVSCSSVAANPELAAIQLFPESIFLHWPLTFEEICDRLGPDASHFYETGVHEAIWLRPCSEGEFDHDQIYFPPSDTTHTEAWAFYGLSVAETGNLSEPIEGLEGEYRIIPLWPLVIMAEG